jgi:uncharacterized protein (TIGR02452 family)
MNHITAWNQIKIKCSLLEIDTKDKVYNYDYNFDLKKYERFEKVNVSVVNNDCLDEALVYDPAYTVLLNMGNPSIPGGHISTVGAQEEDLFRRTDLCIHLDKEYYPLNEPKIVLSKNVRVFSRGLRDRYVPYPSQMSINTITCSSVINYSHGNMLTSEDADTMRLKIETIFQTACICGYEIVILSALGCGGFRCPPEHISLIFKVLIEKYEKCFRQIVFAIFDENYPKCNFSVFKSTLIG